MGCSAAFAASAVNRGGGQVQGDYLSIGDWQLGLPGGEAKGSCFW
jgi:hypothetical protein